MNVAAFILGLVGVAINFFPFAILTSNNNPFGDLGFGMFFMGWIQRRGELFFFIYGVFSIVFLVNQIMAIFRSYHALKRNRNKNVPGFFKFTALLCLIEAAVMIYVYSLYKEAISDSGLYGLSRTGIAPYVPMLLQVLCFSLASYFAHEDEQEEYRNANSKTAYYPSTTSTTSSTQNSPAPQKTKTFEPVLGVETDALIKRGNIFLEDNNFDEAERYFEQAINQSPENSQAYLGKLMAELKVHNTDELSKVSTPLKEHKLFQRALSFATEEEKRTLENYLETQEQNIKEKTYSKALKNKEKINSSFDAQNIIKVLKSIAPYKDSETIIQELEQKKKDFEVLEKNYMNAHDAKRELDSIQNLNNPDIEKFNRVAEMFETLGDYKHSKTLAEEIRRSGIESVEKFKEEKRNKKLAMIFIIIVIIAIGGFYGYRKISERTEQQRIERARIEAEKNRIEAEKQEKKSRIEALKLQLQGQN